MADVSIRPGTPGDVPAILDLVKTCLGEKESAPPRTEAYWRWKHEENPFGASPVLVAEAPGGQLAGVRAFLRWRWQGGHARRQQGHARQQVPAVRAVDTAVHPDWRGRGLFTRLTMRLVERMQEEGVAFVFNTPNAQSRPGYLKMGWEALGRVSFWVRPRRPLRGLKALLFSAAGAPPARRPSWLGASGFEGAGALLAEEHRRPLRALLAQPEASARRRYTTARSLEYLRWRYADVPGFGYRAVWDLGGGGGEDGAALIFRGRVRSGLRELRLCEVLARPTEKSLNSARALVRQVARAVPADYIVAMAARGTPEQQVLPWAGFLPLPHLGPHFTVRPLNVSPAAPSPVERAHWRLHIGDLEVF